jgi:thiol-disulfide isomerase/thioredoxin
MMSSKRLGSLLALGAAALAAALGQPAQAATVLPQVGMPAPALSGVDLAGVQHDLATYRGKWVFVDFWASWCAPCMHELPSVVAMQQELQAKPDFAVLSVSLDQAGSRQGLASTVAEQGIVYPVLFDGQAWSGPVVQEWGVNAIPATFLVNPEGVVVARDIPPAQVQTVIAQESPARLQPRKISASEELLPDSPSTGRGGLRDLRITVSLSADPSASQRYRLYIDTARPGPDGAATPSSARYEVTLSPGPGEGRVQADIRGMQSAGDAAAVLGAPADPGQPGAGSDPRDPVVEVSLRSQHMRFTVPVPVTCQQLSYAVLVFDQQLGDFVGNGQVHVDLNPQ